MSEYIFETGVREHGGAYEHRCEKIMRCRDCRNYHPELYNNFTCDLLYYNMSADDYCSRYEPALKCELTDDDLELLDTMPALKHLAMKAGLI